MVRRDTKTEIQWKCSIQERGERQRGCSGEERGYSRDTVKPQRADAWLLPVHYTTPKIGRSGQVEFRMAPSVHIVYIRFAHHFAFNLFQPCTPNNFYKRELKSTRGVYVLCACTSRRTCGAFV
jgi:hypothetical protein